MNSRLSKDKLCLVLINFIPSISISLLVFSRNDPLLEWDVPWSKHLSSNLCIIIGNRALCDVYVFNGPTYDFMFFLDGYFSFMGHEFVHDQLYL